MTASGRPTYGNWRAPRSAGLWNLGLAGTGLLLGSLAIIVVTATSAGLLPALTEGAVLAGVLALMSVRDRHALSAGQRVTARLSYARGRRAGAHLYRSGPLSQIPHGRSPLPGLLAGAELIEAADSYGRPFAVIRHPGSGDYAAVLACEPDGAALVDPAQVDTWVAHWGAFLASLGDEPGIVAASVTVETAPDTGHRLRREVTSQLDPAAPPVAAAMLGEVMATYPSGSATVRAWVTVTIAATPRPGARRRGTEELTRDLASRLPKLCDRLRGTGAGAVRPLPADQVCELVRVAYDPQAAPLVDAARADGTPLDLEWSQVGPAAAEAHWDRYVHDGAVSVSWTMTGAPRGVVYSSVLADLLAPHPDVARKRVTLLYRPLESGRAAETVEDDQRNADFRANVPRPSARARLDAAAARQAAEEEARGAGLVNFGLLVTATVTDSARLPDAVAAVDSLAAGARIRLRPAYGSQDAAFAAALPLGLTLARHLRVPTTLREAM